MNKMQQKEQKRSKTYASCSREEGSRTQGLMGISCAWLWLLCREWTAGGTHSLQGILYPNSSPCSLTKLPSLQIGPLPGPRGIQPWSVTVISHLLPGSRDLGFTAPGPGRGQAQETPKGQTRSISAATFHKVNVLSVCVGVTASQYHYEMSYMILSLMRISHKIWLFKK